jgi:benzoylformate decarboxylase
VGDGSAMYSVQSLWSAAHHKLPLTVVLINNGGYRIIKQRLLAFHGDDHFVGMDFKDPPVDYTAIAKALGLKAIRVENPADLSSVLSSAFNRPDPDRRAWCDRSVQLMRYQRARGYRRNE